MFLLTRNVCFRLFVLIPAIACGGPRRSTSTTGASPVPGDNTGSGIVWSAQELHEHGGSLLAFLYARVSGMVVDYRSQPCPSVELRGRKSLFGSSDPVVYVDGARTGNSCILEMLSTTDISSVEVYPNGITHRPGYEAHPNGLILVFLEDGSVLEAASWGP